MENCNENDYNKIIQIKSKHLIKKSPSSNHNCLYCNFYLYVILVYAMET